MTSHQELLDQFILVGRELYTVVDEILTSVNTKNSFGPDIIENSQHVISIVNHQHWEKCVDILRNHDKLSDLHDQAIFSKQELHNFCEMILNHDQFEVDEMRKRLKDISKSLLTLFGNLESYQKKTRR